MTRDATLHRSPAPRLCAPQGSLCACVQRLAKPFSVAFLTLILTTATSALSPATAQQPSLLDSNINVDTNQPMLLQADELVYDNQNNRVRARGNVEIYFNNYTLLADEVIYDQDANTLEAEGNVRIKEPDGAIVNADRIRLTDDFRDGFIDSLRIVTKEDARIAAATATRKDGETTVFERAVFTPCKPCKDDPEKAPLWQIKAAKIIHKRSEGNIYYENAALEIYGVPVAWFPYFFHADPSVKRRSGFLIPSVGQSEDLGFMTAVPYFWAISPDMDFTFAPRYMTKQGVLWQGEWRQRFANGTYTIDMNGIYQQDGSLDSIDEDVALLEDKWRGSVVTKGLFSLGSWWQYGWDVTLESDDTYRRFYKLDSVVRTDRVSKIFAEGMNDRNYLGAYLYHFGGLLADDDSNAESRAHPQIDYNYVFADSVLGGELSFDADITSLSRDDGADSSKLIAEVKWRRELIDDFGQIVTPFARLRGDVYKISNYIDPITELTADKETVTRGMATAGLQYSYPFVAHTDRAAHVIEPVGQIIARPNGINQDAVPNEDAKSLVFDDTLLFDIDKFSGYDRIETGVRANVGLRYTMQLYDAGYIRAVLGQSYQLAGDNPFWEGTGLASRQSDYVAGLYFEPATTMRFLAQSRFDQDTFDLERIDVTGNASYGPFSGSVNYAFTRATPITEFTEDQQEVVAAANIQLAEYWSAFGTLRYDIEGRQILTDTLGIQYADECFVLAVTFKESYIQDRDVEPDRSIMVRFEFKHLGGTSFETEAVNQLIADTDTTAQDDT